MNNTTLMKRTGFLLALILLFSTPAAKAYGVLTHQAIIDAAWKDSIEPLLRRRFPNATDEDLLKAHAHAYGGSIVQDMGYFPFGNTFFTDLTHYVRSGDFVANMIKSATTVEEYGFALGAMSHYNADIHGHPLGTNKAVALVYPKVKAEHGREVTYAEDPVSHVKTEFGFDVLQVARGNYASDDYQAFIGFKVSKELLEKAFLETYGLKLNDVFLNVPLAIGTYRYTIRGLMPDLTKAAWQAKNGDIQKASPGATRRKFHYHMSRAEFNKTWGNDYERPNIFARFVAWIIKVLPKIGPLQTLAFKPPTPEAEKLFYHSFNTTVENYTKLIQQLRQQQDKLQLTNMQLDTGKPTIPADYKLTDETYAKLVLKLTKSDFEHMSPALRQNILEFYQSNKALKEVEEGDRAEVSEALTKLRALQL
ncbi:zinc dependent phospholipase C family protein [Pontibacter sp. JH31]|uniref:Zinc dependent phospholipase C family protein n=1 Tax=Pontibacter aquaedesilientis TaxID=2766980 RepID=A0ABR7XK18_9BACT|nr:zinc dependent phospholipase C family protein [Pontibacter aquaedesilientis]MBD1398631.1 zinc dependent phospholipase C family protein [Pontibacter aquaedesilientis]